LGRKKFSLEKSFLIFRTQRVKSDKSVVISSPTKKLFDTFSGIVIVGDIELSEGSFAIQNARLRVIDSNGYPSRTGPR